MHRIHTLIASLLLTLLLSACAHPGSERSSSYQQIAGEPKSQNPYFRCVPGTAIPRFTPSGNVPESMQVPRVGSCLRR